MYFQSAHIKISFHHSVQDPLFVVWQEMDAERHCVYGTGLKWNTIDTVRITVRHHSFM